MISAAHLHLIMNHIPLLGISFGTVLLTFYYFRQNLKPILLAAFVTILISALFGLPTFYSGESAEDLVENQAHVSKTFLKEHEEAAEVTVWVLGTAGLLSFLSLVSLLFNRDVLTKRLTLATLMASLFAIGFTARTANLGGKISHPELRDSQETTRNRLKNEEYENRTHHPSEEIWKQNTQD